MQFTNVAMAPIKGTATFRADVEGLRAIAILLVVAFHAKIPGVSGGFVGVDVFFVVSGYLITGLLALEIERTGRIGLLRFYARRARRLLPASALVVMSTLVAEYLLLSPLERARHVRAATGAALYVSNIYFQRQSSTYFALDNAGNPFLHTWSLAVEEQFYLVWPLLIALSFAAFRSKQVLATAMLAISIVSAALCLWLATVDQPAAFYASPARGWEFGVGGLAALVPAAAVFRFGAWARFIGWIGLGAVMAGGLLLTPSTVYPGVATLLPVFGTVAVLLAGTATTQREAIGQGVTCLLGTRPLLLIGRLSYSWYLWHWPMLVIGAAVIPGLELPGRLALVLAALGAAAASYAVVENPIRFNRHLAERPVLTFGLAAVVTIVSVGATMRAARSAAAEAATPAQRNIMAAVESFPRPLYLRGCLLDFGDERLRDCTFGNVSSPTTLVLFGDSHAAQWFSAYETIAKARGWRLVALTKSGCPAARVAVGLWGMKQSYPECTVWREAALERILMLQPALVVIASSDAHVTSMDGRSGARLNLRQWQDGTHATLELLDQAGIRTVVLRDPPGSAFDVPTCLSRAASHGRAVDGCGPARSLVLREDVFRATQMAAVGLRHVSFLDLTDRFCDATTCSPLRDGIIVYRNPGHITDAYARSLAPYLAQR